MRHQACSVFMSATRHERTRTGADCYKENSLRRSRIATQVSLRRQRDSDRDKILFFAELGVLCVLRGVWRPLPVGPVFALLQQGALWYGPCAVSWKIADVIDFEWFLAEDGDVDDAELRARDGQIFENNLSDNRVAHSGEPQGNIPRLAGNAAEPNSPDAAGRTFSLRPGRR